MANVFAVVMAGGIGSRFWPRSRERSPKQLLEIVGTGSMLQRTVARLAALADAEHTLVVTNAVQRAGVAEQLPAVPAGNILVEPVGRNTAPCIALAAAWIRRKDPEALMMVLPADHLMRDEKEFVRVMRTSLRVAEETGALLTLGIQPTSPETGYGYIQYADEEAVPNPYRKDEVFRVKTFAEKPNLETAERFLESGDFLWNSGMFVWKVQSIWEEIQLHLPETAEQLETVDRAIGTPSYEQVLETAYGLIRGISIDYGVMEKARNVYVVKGEFGWSDVGSWDEAARLAEADHDGNVVRGKVLLKDTHNVYVEGGERFVAAIGVEDLIVVSTDDALLICRKGKSQDVKEVVDYIRRKQINDLL
jgi:mannose-1-phosphate guanylyltransferase